MTDLSGMVEVVADALREHMNAHGPIASHALAQAALTALTPHIEKLVEEARGGRAELPEGHDAVLALRARLKWLCHYDEVWPLVEAAFATRAHSIAPVDDAEVGEMIRRLRARRRCKLGGRMPDDEWPTELINPDGPEAANLLSRLSASGVGHG